MRRKQLIEILLQDYEAAAKHYAWAVAEMQRSSLSSSGEQYRKTRRVAETAYKECERLRKAASKIGRHNKVFALTNIRSIEARKHFTTEKDVEAPTTNWQIVSPRTRRSPR
jgi:hypothetical protein